MNKKCRVLLPLLFFTQIVCAQFDIQPLTHFSFKSSKKKVMEKVTSLGGYVPESIREEKSLGVKGIKMLGYENDLVIFAFYEDQLYNIAFTIKATTKEEAEKIVADVTVLFNDDFGPSLTIKDGHTLWLADVNNPDSDKITITYRDNHEISIQFIEGNLLNLAHPEHKRKALQKIHYRST